MVFLLKFYLVDGIQIDFLVIFDYFDESYVCVCVDKVYIDEVGVGYKFEWINRNIICVIMLIESNLVLFGSQIELV